MGLDHQIMTCDPPRYSGKYQDFCPTRSIGDRANSRGLADNFSKSGIFERIYTINRDIQPAALEDL
ncbi:Hypothetical predicted protein, partial [Paramuricea clavata]